MEVTQSLRLTVAGLTWVNDMSESTNEPLIAVHVCRVCGAATERSAVNPDNTITGLVKCPSCGHEGDLNIEIRPKSTKRLCLAKTPSVHIFECFSG